MTTTEVTHYTPDFEAVRQPSDFVDLTMLFGGHGTIEDAEKNMALIEPNSVVFLEGINRDDSMMQRKRALDMLNRTHIVLGTDSPIYQDIKAKLIVYFDEQLEMHAQDIDPGYRLYVNTVLKLCVSKDCLTTVADYVYTTGNQDADLQTLLDAQQAEMTQLCTDREKTFHFMNIQPGEAKALRVKQAYDYQDHETTYHDIREKYAVATILGMVEELAASHNLKDMNTLPDGRLKCYVSYGAGHGDSLTARLANEGLDPTIVALAQPDEWVRIDKDKATERANRQRRIAHKALLRLVGYYTASGEQAPILLNEAYSSLAYLNGDDAATRSFVVRCLAIRQQVTTDPARALQHYLSLMREFMPEPERFVDQAVELPAAA